MFMAAAIFGGSQGLRGAVLTPPVKTHQPACDKEQEQTQSSCRCVSNWKWAVKTQWIFDIDLRISAVKEGPGPAAVRLLWASSFQGFQQLLATIATFRVSAETNWRFLCQRNVPFIQFSCCLPPISWLLRDWLLLLICMENASSNFLILSFFLPHKSFTTH